MTAEEILERGDYIAHFNPNHDPRNGQFTKGHGGSGSRKSSTKREGQREDNMAYKYNKPGESGWVGLGRAIKAKVKGDKEYTPRQKQVGKRAGLAAGVMGAASVLATLNNYIGAQAAAETMGMTINPAYVMKTGTGKAGAVAAASALAVIGGHMVSDYMRGRKQD